jgi:hypothetical protein
MSPSSPPPAETGFWRDYWLATNERQGHPVRIGFVTDQPDTWLTAIANGYGIALTPESAARYYARPGIIYRPVTGVSPSQVGVAWPPANDTDPVVRDFVRCCLDSNSAARGLSARRNSGAGGEDREVLSGGVPHLIPDRPVAGDGQARRRRMFRIHIDEQLGRGQSHLVTDVAVLGDGQARRGRMLRGDVRQQLGGRQAHLVTD